MRRKRPEASSKRITDEAVTEYRTSYDKGVEARKSGLYSSWHEASFDSSYMSMAGFIDGFEGNTKLYSWRR